MGTDASWLVIRAVITIGFFATLWTEESIAMPPFVTAQSQPISQRCKTLSLHGTGFDLSRLRELP
jgi:hypothetical protein